MLKSCGKERPTCKNCSVNLKMTILFFFDIISLLENSREIYFCIYIRQLLNMVYEAQNHGVLYPYNIVNVEHKAQNHGVLYPYNIVNVEHKAQKHGVLSPN